MSSATGSGKREALIAALSQDIAAGAYRHDTRLPTLAALRARFAVSDITARGALAQLAEMGLIISVPGHGWHVREDHRRRLPLLTIDERGGTTRDVWRTWLANEGLSGGHHLTVTVDIPPHHVVNHLALGPQARCSIRRRVRFVNNEPMMISTAYWPLRLSDGRPMAEGTPLELTGSGDAVDLNKPSPLDIAAQLGYEITADEDQISCRMPEPGEVETLELSARGMPVLVNCRTSYDPAGVALRCTHDVMAAHKFMLVVYHQRKSIEREIHD